MSRLAALDLGSNSFHLLVADTVPGGGIKRRDTSKLTLRLAEPVAKTGELGRQARDRATEAFTQLVREARRAGAQRLVAVATEALRLAADGTRLREKWERDTGVRVKLISGMEEAELSLRGMVGALSLRPGADLLGMDLGGGSYEVAYGGLGPMRAAVSLPFGSARLAARSGHDPLRLSERVALYAETMEALVPLVEQVRGLREAGPLRAAGTAGTIRDFGRCGLALAGGVTPEQVRGLVVTRPQLEVAYARIVSMTTAERVDLPGVSPKRVDLLPAGGAVVLATMEAFGLEQLELCDWGLREGALLDVLDGAHVVTDGDFTDLAERVSRSRRG